LERWLGRFSDLLKAVMCFVVGLLFACHGAQKLFGVLGGQAQLSGPTLLSAAIIELVWA
jgi:putative oxidoreductase